MIVWLTPAQVSERTGIAVKTLANWRSLGKGPAFVRQGRIIRYEQAVLTAWQESMRSA